jgi:hypothetical protein
MESVNKKLEKNNIQHEKLTIEKDFICNRPAQALELTNQAATHLKERCDENDRSKIVSSNYRRRN